MEFEQDEQQRVDMGTAVQMDAGRGGGRPDRPGPGPVACPTLDVDLRAAGASAAPSSGPVALPSRLQGPGGPGRQAGEAAANGSHPLEKVPARKRLRKAGELAHPGSGRSGGSGRGGDESSLPLSEEGGGRPETQRSERGGRGSESGGDDVEEDEEEEEQEAISEFHEANDTQCAQCDDGGNLMSCDGPCMRAFHYGFSVDGEEGEGEEHWDFGCNPLGMPPDLGKLLTTSGANDLFLCPNCLANRQHCFKCKREGGPERDVFRCMVNSCGKFYHPNCVGKGWGKPFLCDLHTCRTCKQSGASSKRGELVPCRRCPVAYHRHCLPHSLLGSSPRRVWLADFDAEGNLDPESEVSHSLLYCPNHKVQPDNSVTHRRPLFDPSLLARCRLHYAQLYPHLDSSKAVLAEEARREEERRRDADSDLEDMPLSKRAKPRTSFQLRSPLASPANAPPAPSLAATAAAELRLGLASPAKPPATRALMLGGDAPAAAVAAAAAAEGGEGEVAQGEQEAPEPAAAAAAEEWSGEEGPVVVEPLPPGLSRQEARKRAEAELRDAERLVTLDQLWRETRRPEPYAMPMKRTIDEDRLRGLERSFGFASDPTISEATLRVLVDANSTEEVYQRHDDLMMVLAPYLHGAHYSYGRHFTDKHLLKEVVERLTVFLRDGDQVVDFSCGANEWVPALRRRCLSEGLVVSGRAYDIILAKDDTDFVQKSWFDARPETEGLAPSSQLVIGLKPPFGKNNSLADKFVERAARFHPRLIVLIVPPDTVVPNGYCILYESRQMCRREDFYMPGSVKRSWSKDVPAFRIMVRNDYWHETINLRSPSDWEPIPLPPMAPAASVPQQQHHHHAMPASAGFVGAGGSVLQPSGMAHGPGFGGLGPMQPNPALMQHQKLQEVEPFTGVGPGPLHRHEALTMGDGGGYDVPPGFGGNDVPPGFDGGGRGFAGGLDRPLWEQRPPQQQNQGFRLAYAGPGGGGLGSRHGRASPYVRRGGRGRGHCH